MRHVPTARDLSRLFAAAVTAAATGGCGPCRHTAFDYEKVLPLDPLALEGRPVEEQCDELCGQSNGILDGCREGTDDQGDLAVVCEYGYQSDCGGAGRVPAGLRAPRAGAVGTALGRHFARAAYLEAASVHAFRVLSRELTAHAAPASLVHAAERAMRDERRHARSMAALTRRFGARCERPVVARSGVRALAELLRDNAREGCVRETLGAAVATWQASHASDREVARAMRSIASDETRHAALAWAVHAWGMARVPPHAARAIDDEVRRLSRRLGHGRSEPPPAVIREAGAPPAAVRRRLVRALAPLWERPA